MTVLGEGVLGCAPADGSTVSQSAATKNPLSTPPHLPWSPAEVSHGLQLHSHG